ncbi:MAG: MCE family protein [Candidatus Marinimicrobia bacterium]|jgi:phospholipid/cholesterol/gamma-HCH transport system substrate-binding protein|nr:MCE family protein [Candidatus Neomarinimicrobiota bacterium]MBT3576158.1 MCE family protein [Candidatus Neomarinimicrobiota bacterium]MBT3680577.1 MCE family protein [Candidatus Neomarinimicrobiota bacterium]MBT3950868.1 MCE family protein [Candidatus Neomarinimicrobiota bacterium]MBT4251865.1 MCE family protein [Candidatus Neomarinimicrobiota bacterium]
MRPEEKRQEVIVGVVVLIILVATVMGIMWGNKADIFSSRSYYTVRVARASGLEEGDPVTVSGVPKGVVDDFIVREDSVDIIIGVDKDITLYSDATAIISNQELLGSKKVEVNPGSSGNHLGEHGVFRGTFAGGLEDIFETTGAISTDFQTLLGNFNKTLLLLNKSMEEDVQASLHSIHNTSKLIDSLMVSDIQPGLLAMKGALQQAENMVDAKRGDIDTIVTNLKTVSFTLNKVVDDNKSKLNRSLASLDKIGADLSLLSVRLKDPKSSLGRLTNSDSLYQRLDSISYNINEIVKEIKNDPKKYLEHVNVNVDMFGGGK